VWRTGGMIQAKAEVLVEKPVPLPLCGPKVPHGLSWDGTLSRTVRGRRLTAWAMTRLLKAKLYPTVLRELVCTAQ
jgi:hypothetical protein